MNDHDHANTNTDTAVDCPECCCILEICCNPLAADAAFAAKLVRDLGCSLEEAKRYVLWTRKHFALAPRSFQPVIADIVAMARTHKG